MRERFKLVLCDFSEALCEEWKLAFADFPEVEIKHGRFEEVDFDCINSPANSFGLMDGGIDEAITMHFGQQMMDRVQEMVISKYAGEQPVGTSEIVRATPDDAERIKYVSHTPTMIIPELISHTNNVYMAMKAMLLAVERHNRVADFNKNESTRINTLVCSGLGTGAGRVPFKQAAIDMAKAYHSFKHRPSKINWAFATIRYDYIRGKQV